jgi:hypothetical protein
MILTTCSAFASGSAAKALADKDYSRDTGNRRTNDACDVMHHGQKHELDG